MTMRTKLVLMCACVAGIQLASAAADTWLSGVAARHHLGSRDAHEQLEQLARIESGLVWQVKEVGDLIAETHESGEQDDLVQLGLAQQQVVDALARYRVLVGNQVDARGEARASQEGNRHTWLASITADLARSAEEVAQLGRGANLERDAWWTLDERFRRSIEFLQLMRQTEAREVAEQDEAADRAAGLALTVSWLAPLASTLVLVVLLYLMLRSISRPLADLTVGAARVAGGDLETHIPVRTGDELGELATAFNRMQRSLKARSAERDQALRDARFRELSEAAPVAIAELDAGGCPVYANRRWLELTGAAPGRPWSAVVHAEDRGCVLRLHGEPGGAAQELRIVRGERTIWVLAQVAPLGDSRDGRAIAVLADVTAQKEAIARAEDLGRELMMVSRKAGMAEVSAGVLHNVGNVLNSLNVSASALKEQLTSSRAAGVVKAARMVEEHAGDLAAFLTSERGKLLPPFLIQTASHLAEEQRTALADVARIETAVQHMRAVVATQQSYAVVSAELEPLRLSAVVEDVLCMNATSFHRDEIRVVKRFEADPELLSDRHRIMQILINLISNARQAVTECGRSGERTIVISTHLTEHGCVALEVADNGCGIAPEHLARIFEHGFTTRKSGHGFGLNSSRQAARDMQGSLSVNSSGAGHGAAFVLELPLPPQEKAA
jgi:PAS domain S-box-containing protein